MIRKLPQWVWVGGLALAFNAGMINVIALLSADRQAVSHLTGTTSYLSIALAKGDWHSLEFLAGVAGAFFLGAIVSGVIIRSPALQMRRRYTLLLLLEACALIWAMWIIALHPWAAIDVLGFACGLQNAMASTYSGAIVRTTHMTGMYTDLGVLLGQTLRGAPIDWRRLLLCTMILSGFSAGGVIGAWLSIHHGPSALLAPIGLTIGLALVYAVLHSRSKVIHGNSSDPVLHHWGEAMS